MIHLTLVPCVRTVFELDLAANFNHFMRIDANERRLDRRLRKALSHALSSSAV